MMYNMVKEWNPGLMVAFSKVDLRIKRNMGTEHTFGQTEIDI